MELNPNELPPGLAGYVMAQQQSEQRGLRGLQQMSALQALVEHADQQKRSQDLRTALMESGGDPEVAMQKALKTGDVKAAHDLASLVKLKQEKDDAAQFANAPQMTPDQLDILGQSLAQRGHPGAATVMNVADKRRAAATEAATAATMRSAPAIQPDPQEVQQSADQGTPAVLAKPAQPGLFAPLMQSEVPSIANAAKNLQTQVNAQPNVPSSHWQKQFENLSTMEARYMEARAAAKGKADSKEAEAPSITNDTLQMDAWRYLSDGTLPPNMGRGMQGAQQASTIRNRAAELAKEIGMTPDEIRFAQLTNKTQMQAIGKLANARAQILQFEKTAELNADLALKASDNVWRGNSPLINRPVQWLRENAAGDPAASKFNAANETFVSEYARVMSGGYGAAQTTEGAQTRAHKLLNTANGPQQYKSVVEQLRLEMANRVKALNDQMEEEKGRLRGGKSTPATPPAVATPAASPAAAASNPAVDALLEKYK